MYVNSFRGGVQFLLKGRMERGWEGGECQVFVLDRGDGWRFICNLNIRFWRKIFFPFSLVTAKSNRRFFWQIGNAGRIRLCLLTSGKGNKFFFTKNGKFKWQIKLDGIQSSVEMKSSQVVRAPGCQCHSRNSPGFDPSTLRHSRI